MKFELLIVLIKDLNLFVFCCSTTEEGLQELLSKAGNVSSIVLPKNRENNEECRGFAFVTLSDKDSFDVSIFIIMFNNLLLYIC